MSGGTLAPETAVTAGERGERRAGRAGLPFRVVRSAADRLREAGLLAPLPSGSPARGPERGRPGRDP